MKKNKVEDKDISFEDAFARLKDAVEREFAKRPPEAAPAVVERTALRPQSAAEADLFRAEMAYRIAAVLCADPSRCAEHRCRRLRRCVELEEAGKLVEEQRALVAREQAAAAACPDDAPGAQAGRRRSRRRGKRNH
jgi:hypothetical protein